MERKPQSQVGTASAASTGHPQARRGGLLPSGLVVLSLCLLPFSPLRAADTYYLEPTPGTYSYGDGSAIVLASGDRFWFQGGSAGSYTLLNDFEVNQNGSINWSGGSATEVIFGGNVNVIGSFMYLSGDAHSPGGDKNPQFTGVFTLNQNTTLRSEPQRLHAPLLSGGIDGAQHTLFLRSAHAGRALRVGGAGSGFNVGAVDIALIDLVVEAADATDDYFATLNANGGQVVSTGTSNLILRRGTFDLDRDYINQSGGTVLLEPLASGAVRFVTNGTPGLTLGTGHAVSNLGLPGGVLGSVKVVAGGMLTHKTIWPNNIMLSDSLALENGAVWRFNHANSTRLEFAAGKSLTFGDGDPGTHETVTIRTIGGHTNGPQRIMPHTVIDDGNVTLVYQSTTGNSFVGWHLNPGDGTSMHTFREGSAGTVFDTSTGNFKAIGIDTNNNAMVVSGPVSVVGDKQVSFHLPNNRDASVINAERTGGQLGAVTVDTGGSFVIKDSAATVNASQIVVADGGSIGGIGTFVAPITVNAGGYLAPGNSPGQLVIVGDLTLASGANYAVEVVTGSQIGNGITGYDQTVVTGAVSLDGANLLLTADMFGLQRGQLLTIVANDGLDPVLGTFAGLPEGATVDMGGTDFFAISYNGFGLGNDVVLLSLIPEPASLALLGLGGLVALRWRRR